MIRTRLAHLAWPAYEGIAQAGGLVVVPAGAIEQHGPHLPLVTDALLARALAELACRRLGAHFVEPLLYGVRSDPFSGGGEDFPGTVSLGHETFLAVAREILSRLAADGFRRFVVLNAHYENAPLLREASRRLVAEVPDCRVLFCNWWDLPPREKLLELFPGEFPGMDLEHGAFLETSLMLHLAPELVGPRSAFPSTLTRAPGYELYPERLQRGADHCGALASARDATAEAGEILCGLIVDALADRVERHLGAGQRREQAEEPT